LSRLVVEGNRRCRGSKAGRWKVALATDRVDVGAIEQVWVRPPVREVAGCATLALNDCMLIEKRTSRFAMALYAKAILLDGRIVTFLLVGTVRVVTIRTLNQSLIYFVMEGHRELRLNIGVAFVAEGGLTSFE